MRVYREGLSLFLSFPSLKTPPLSLSKREEEEEEEEEKKKKKRKKEKKEKKIKKVVISIFFSPSLSLEHLER